MIDLSLSHEQSGGTLLGSDKQNNGPKYPPGLTLTLDTQTLQKLAMGLPQVGDAFTDDDGVPVRYSESTDQVSDGDADRTN